MTEIRMRGDGYYGPHCSSQGLVIDRALPLILQALDALDPASSGTLFAIADFGAADGGTSIGLLRTLLSELRARAPDRPITLTHTDLPYNDFSALFRLVHGLLPGREHEGLRISAAYSASPVGPASITRSFRTPRSRSASLPPPCTG